MKKLFLVLFSTCLFFLNAQDNDQRAKAILDDLSKTTKSYKTITAECVLTVLNKDKKQIEKQSIKVFAKVQKFKLEIPGNTIVCDGKTLWSYNKDAQEVTIKNFDADNDQQLNLSKIFTIYETGYKYKFDKEDKVGLVNCNVIDLFPAINPEKKKFHTIKLYIDKAKKQIVQMKMLMKDGGTQLYEIKKLKPNAEMLDSFFVFDLKGFKPDQISDER